jgi:hypothetical protein
MRRAARAGDEWESRCARGLRSMSEKSLRKVHFIVDGNNSVSEYLRMKPMITIRIRKAFNVYWVLEGWNQRRKVWFTMQDFKTEAEASEALEAATKSFAPRNNVTALHHV